MISVPDLASFTAKLKDVVLAEGVGHGCSRESMNHIQEAIVNHKLNRVVIGGCSPRTHESRFQDVLRRAGLNKYLLEMANLREQDTWVHLGIRLKPGPTPDNLSGRLSRLSKRPDPLPKTNCLSIGMFWLWAGG